MKTQNELILNKLVELGYLDFATKAMIESLKITHNSVYELVLADATLNTLISECGKRAYPIIIDNQNISICKSAISIIYEGTYNSQSVADAFCKVVGVEL